MPRFPAFFFILPVILCGAEKCYTQNRTIDSLRLALKNAKHDTLMCNVLSQLAKTANDEEWPKYNEQLLQLKENKLNTITKNHKDFRVYQKRLGSAIYNVGYLGQC